MSGRDLPGMGCQLLFLGAPAPPQNPAEPGRGGPGQNQHLVFHPIGLSVRPRGGVDPPVSMRTSPETRFLVRNIECFLEYGPTGPYVWEGLPDRNLFFPCMNGAAPQLSPMSQRSRLSHPGTWQYKPYLYITYGFRSRSTEICIVRTQWTDIRAACGSYLKPIRATSNRFGRH